MFPDYPSVSCDYVLIDTEDVFSSVIREAMLHSISIMFPIISTFILNCCGVPASLLVTGNKEIISREGTTQRDPTATGA